MGAGVDVGVDAQAHRRRGPLRPRRPADSSLSSPSLSTLKQRTPASSACASRRGLADAGEHDAAVAAGRQHALQLAAGDDVEAAAGARKVCSTARLELAFIA